MSSASWSHLLLFDGVCHLCDGAVQFILRHDQQDKIHFASIQSELGSRLYREHGLDPDTPQSMLLITPDGVLQESDAALEIARLLGWPWSLAGLLRLIPHFLRDPVYRFIASHRYQWFGRHDHCMLPKPEWRQRFLS